MNFIKNEYFVMQKRRFKIISGMVYSNDLPPSPRKHDAGNCLEFIEVVEEKELGETSWVEIPPKLIANPKTKEEIFCNDWAKMCGSNIRSKELMYSLLERGEIILL